MPDADPETLTADLDLLSAETDSLLRTLDRLDDSAMRAPSLCEGWTRGHVTTHLARNAESLVRLVLWARTGVEAPQYSSHEARDADIEAGAGRSAGALIDDVKETADLLRDALATLALPLRTATIDSFGGPERALDLPRKRLVEVVLHHHDLAAGWTLADAHPLAVADALDRLLDPARTTGWPGLTLTSDEADRYVVGDGAHHVSGPAAGLLAWIARGDAAGVRSDGDLPSLP